MDIVIIRNFNAFGPGQNDGSYGSVIARFAKAALAGDDIVIYGSGDQERDYMYSTDICQAYDFACHSVPAGVINFGTGETHKITEIAAKINHFFGNKSAVRHIQPRAGEVQRLCCDITKAKALGFKPHTDFDRDLIKYLTWYKEFNSCPKDCP
jgi:UDP-glucose 4-epimerase